MKAVVISARQRRLGFDVAPTAARRGPGGFTLIEVVLALTIFALLAGIVYGAFALSHGAVVKSQASAERNQKRRASVDLLGGYIRSAYPYRPTPQDQTIYFDGTNDSLTFISAYSRALGGRGMAKIQIAAEKSDTGQTALTLEETTPVRLNDDQGGGGQSHRLVLQQRATDLRLAYLDPQAAEETWEERWDGQERRMLPRAVRLTYLDENGRAVRWIFPVMMMVLAP